MTLKKYQALSNDAVSEIELIRSRYSSRASALLPALHVAERQAGWLSPEVLLDVAHLLGMPPAHVRGVATFHVMYKHSPSGRHMVYLCTNVSCMLFGAERLLDILRDKYGLTHGATSPDGRFTLLVMECIGACDCPPSMLVDEDLHTSLTPQSILDILEGYK